VPQLSVPPQPLEAVPQFCPAGHVVAAVQTHVLVGLQVVFGAVVQLPQLSVPPQPLAIVPQVAPAAAHVVAVQPHWLGVPAPPQVWGAVQAAPQLRVPPQPFEIVPQLSPAGHLVKGTQASASLPASLASTPASFEHSTFAAPTTGTRCHERTHLFWQRRRMRISSSRSLSEQNSLN
jgi:hypothetical protein